MSNDTNNSMATLALRRRALIAQCSMQRLMLMAETRALLQPITPSGWRQSLGKNLKIPMTIAGVVVGLLVTKPSRALPLLQAGTALWGLVRNVLPLLRKGSDSGE